MRFQRFEDILIPLVRHLDNTTIPMLQGVLKGVGGGGGGGVGQGGKC